jgi:hypothetical protein
MSDKTPEGRFGFLRASLREGDDREEPSGGQRLVLAMVISVATLAALALTLVWLNIERTKLAYRERTLQRDMGHVLDLSAKLSVERDHLLSPHELGRKAESLGLGPAKPGQLRRMGEHAETDEKVEE